MAPRNSLDYFKYRNAWRYNGAPHTETRLTDSECRQLLQQGGYLVRNNYDFDTAETTDFWYIVKDSFGALDELSGNTRKKVRRSLERFEFKLVDHQTVRDAGYPIIAATYADYPVVDRPMNPKVFEEMMEDFSLFEYDYWGMFDRTNGEMMGFCINRVWDNACGYEILGILPKYKRKSTTYPYYGLYYSMNRHYLQEKRFKYVTSGTRSVTEHSNIQPFLEEKFHFRKAYCRLAIHYQWWMRLAVKALYPFRKIITIPQVKALLNMESMTR